MNLGFTIPKPCDENWDTMLPNEQGRHCLSCAKTVVDFTGWEVEDISNYLLQENGARVCGRFRTSQLDTEPEYATAEIIKKIWASRMPEIRKIASMICLFFASFMTASGQTHTKGRVARPLLMGDTIMTTPPAKIDTAKTKPQPAINKINHNKTPQKPETDVMIRGEVQVIPKPTPVAVPESPKK